MTGILAATASDVAALIGLGLIATVAILLAYPKSRPAGVAILSIALLVLIVGGTGLYLTRRRVERRYTAEMETQAASGTNHTSSLPVAPKPTSAGPGSGTADADAPDAPEPDTATEQARGLLRALMRALGAGVADTKKRVKTPPTPDAAEPPATPADENQPAAPARPAWVDGVPHRVGNVYQMAIKIDPCPTREECEAELPEQARKAVAEYADTKLNFGPRIAQELQLPWNYIQKNIIKQQWPEPVATVSYGTWVQLHVLLEFDDQVRKYINDECNKLIVSRRLWYTGTGVVAGLALLSVLFAGLKIDQATGGSYRGRLGLAGVVASLAAATAAYYVVTYVHGPPITHDAAPVETAPIQPAGHTVSDVAKPSEPPAAGFPIWMGPVEVLIITVAGIYILILTALSRKRWAWILGLIACFVIAGLFTPADPLSLLLVVVPLCAMYTIAVFAWKAGREDSGTQTQE